MLLQLAAWALIAHVASCFTHFSVNVNDAKVGLYIIRAHHRDALPVIRPLTCVSLSLSVSRRLDSAWGKTG